ncbi:MAG TPA: hypothetical protein VK665_15335 [Candidatus Elarobacter sp.]|nr:hypothetical protein [Candidatus Elarobacter sp.]
MNAARALPAVTLAAILAVAGGAPARAQSESAVVVHVHEAGGDVAVRDALVRMVGTSAQHTHVARTGDGGDAAFAGARCESGLLLVEAKGYKPLRRRVSCDDASVVIDVALERELPMIGSTRSAPSIAKATIAITPDSAVRRVTPTLVEALDQLAGLSAREQGIGFSAGVRGQDASMTEYSLNGAPIGAGAASLAISTDLLSSASVDEANDAIALFSASPTATPHYSSEFRLGNYQDTFQRYQASGTVHGDGLGYVFVHTSRGSASALNGLTYLDESGLDYEHHGLRHTTGNLVRLTDAVGATSVSLTSSVSNTSAQLIPAFSSGEMPSGPGPGTHQDQTASNPVVFVSAPLRAGQLSLSASRWSLLTWSDDASRLVALAPAPQTAFDRTAGTDLTISFAAAPTRNRTVNAGFTRTTSSLSGVSRAVVAGAAFDGAYALGMRTTETAIGETWRGDPRMPFDVTLKQRSSDRLGGAFEVDASAQYVASPSLRFRYSGAAGTKLVDLGSPQNAGVLADPASAEYDCANGAAFVTGPGATGVRSHAANHDLSMTLTRGAAKLTLAAYAHDYRNASIGAIPFVAASLPTGYFPNGYLGAVEQQYALASGCAGTLSTQRIFVQQAVIGANVAYRGVGANAHLPLGRAWSVDVDAGVERARITGADPLLRATPYYPGAPLPGVPSYKGNVVVTWQPAQRVSALLSAAVSGPHNARQLPAYAVVNAALEREISPSSRIALLATNIFDTLTDPFVSTRLAVPLSDGFGRRIPTFASPLLPRRLELRYSVQVAPGSFR